MSSSSARWHRVELAGDRALLEAEGRAIVVFRAGGSVHAVENACPHAGNPLVEGELRGTALRCAYHLWEFDLETGACLRGETPLRRYPAEERDGVVWIRA